MSEAHVKQNAQSVPKGHLVRQPASNARPTFTIACWVLGVIAFLQLVAIGTALTVRMGNRPAAEVARVYANSNAEPVAARTLEEILSGVAISQPADVAYTPPRQSSPLQMNFIPETSVHSEFPMIANPQVERLVQEARSLTMDGDMMNALLKLEEAEVMDPSEPAVIFHRAGLYENMSLYVKAADQYQRIQQMGTKAGIYFKIAAQKLTEGMDTASARRDVLSIGPMNARKVESEHGVKEASIIITILARPDTPVVADDVELNIYFYDKINGSGGGKIEQSSATATIEKSWVRAVRDWNNAGNEEQLRVRYQIPESNLADEYLLGKREYYGFVVELVYRGEVVDQKAMPGKLNNKHSANRSRGGNHEIDPWMSDDGGMLLPDLESEGLPNYVLPPLPSR